MDIGASWKYDLSYAKYGAQDLIGNLYQIEDELVADIFKTCQRFLEEKGAVARGDLFFLESLPLNLYCAFNEIERSLLVMILPMRPTKSEIFTTSIKIDAFGAIRTVEFTAPKSLRRRKMRRLPDVVQRQINLAYDALESTFKTGLKPFGAFIFDNLYNILNNEIERSSKEGLLGKAFFNVTFRKSSKFRYFFDSDRLQLLIDFFKAHQVPSYSPIELVATLMTSEARDTMNLIMDPQTNQFSHLPSEAFVTLQEDVKFWSAEALMLEYRDLASFTIDKNEKIVFQVNCLREFEQEFSGIFTRARPGLQRQFVDNVKKYSRHIKYLSRIPRPKRDQSTLRAVAEILIELAGKFTGQVIKESVHP